MVTKVQFHFHILENKKFLQLLNWCKCEIHHMQLNSFSTSLFCMLQSTLSLIKYAQPNPISSVIVAIIHDGENEPREWGSLHFSLFFLTSEKKAILNVAHQKKKKWARSKHVLCWPTIPQGRKKEPEGPIVSTHQKAALTVTSAVSKADTVSHHGEIV